MESRRAWKQVIEGIRENDPAKITDKARVENEQRQLRLEEQSQGKDFRRRYFSSAERNVEAEKLFRAPAAHAQGDEDVQREADAACGIWLWDEKKSSR